MLNNPIPPTPYACTALKNFFKAVGISYEHRRRDSFIIRTKENQSTFPCVCIMFNREFNTVRFWRVPSQSETANPITVEIPYSTPYTLIQKMLKYRVITKQHAEPLLNGFLSTRLPSSNTAAILTTN